MLCCSLVGRTCRRGGSVLLRWPPHRRTNPNGNNSPSQRNVCFGMRSNEQHRPVAFSSHEHGRFVLHAVCDSTFRAATSRAHCNDLHDVRFQRIRREERAVVIATRDRHQLAFARFIFVFQQQSHFHFATCLPLHRRAFARRDRIAKYVQSTPISALSGDKCTRTRSDITKPVLYCSDESLSVFLDCSDHLQFIATCEICQNEQFGPNVVDSMHIQIATWL